MRLIKRLLYDFVFCVYAVLYAPLFFLKGKHRDAWRERLGSLSDEAAERLAAREVIWLHAVSLGEARLACHLVQKMRHRLPGAAFLVTTTTASGRAVAKASLAPEDVVMYFPIDLSFVVRRFIRNVRPKIMVLLETELWPNLMLALSEAQVDLVVANARISDKTYPAYRLIRGLMRSFMKTICLCLAQSEVHAKRFIALGVNPARVQVTGNMKFDLEPLEGDARVLKVVSAFTHDAEVTLLAASTHPGEEEALLRIFKELRRRSPGLRLILAPRHVERTPAILSLIAKLNLTCTQLTQTQPSRDPIMVIDAWGVLSTLYTFADVVFVGGSLVRHGGHNIAEVGLAKRAVVFGPHMQNFQQMADEFRLAGATRQAHSESELTLLLEELMQAPQACQRMGVLAYECICKQQGVTQQNIELMLRRLARSAPEVLTKLNH